jgi:hypothetical protein
MGVIRYCMAVVSTPGRRLCEDEQIAPIDRRHRVTLQARLLASADVLADRVGWLRRRLAADKLMRAAQLRAGLDDFGDLSFVDPLQRLLDALASQASLSVVGRIAAKWDAVRFLTSLLRLRAEEARTPAILRERIDRPIFITGLPRSGTTFLHRLMLADQENRAPLVWQTIYPYQPEGGADRRVAQVNSQLRAFERLAPEFRGLHPLYATSPQECSEITAHVFRSLRFDTTYHIPSYRAWLDRAGHVPAYRFHKRFLQHLQYQGTTGARRLGRWVLKCPDHVFAVDAIRAVYPDAGFVFVHRDPVSVLLSVAKLTEVIRAPFTRCIDPIAIGRQESARWLEGASQMIRVAREPAHDTPICHVQHLDLITDPLATLASVYRHFGLPLSVEAEIRIEHAIERQPNGGYAPHAYRFEDHGLDAVAERAKFREYMIEFGIQPEAARRVGSGRVGGSRTSRSLSSPTH